MSIDVSDISIHDLTVHGRNVHIDIPECACFECVKKKHSYYFIPEPKPLDNAPENYDKFPFIDWSCFDMKMYRLEIRRYKTEILLAYQLEGNKERALIFWRG